MKTLLLAASLLLSACCCVTAPIYGCALGYMWLRGDFDTPEIKREPIPVPAPATESTAKPVKSCEVVESYCALFDKYEQEGYDAAECRRQHLPGCVPTPKTPRETYCEEHAGEWKPYEKGRCSNTELGL